MKPSPLPRCYAHHITRYCFYHCAHRLISIISALLLFKRASSIILSPYLLLLKYLILIFYATSEFYLCRLCTLSKRTFKMAHIIQELKLFELQAEIHLLGRRMDTLEAKLDCHNHNNMARLQNSNTKSPNDPLVPLCNPLTGLEIPNFPANANAITDLHGTQLQSILQELDQEVPDDQEGEVDLLRRHLRIQIGLRADQIVSA